VEALLRRLHETYRPRLEKLEEAMFNSIRELLRAETRRESRRVARIAALLIMSSVFTFSAILLGLFAIAYTIAASDPHYTLGFSFSVVAAGAAVIALVISYWSLRQWRALTAESRKTFDALKEGVAWMQRTM
jgi:hypothetical protein